MFGFHHCLQSDGEGGAAAEARPNVSPSLNSQEPETEERNRNRYFGERKQTKKVNFFLTVCCRPYILTKYFPSLWNINKCNGFRMFSIVQYKYQHSYLSSVIKFEI